MLKRKPTSTPSLAELGNTPPVFEDEPKRKFSELYGSANVQGARWFVFSMIELLIIGGLATTIYHMTPLVRTVPYMIKVDEGTAQVVGRPVAASEFRVENRMVETEVRAFARGLLQLDPFLTRANLERISARVTGKASAELKDFLVKDRPFERLAKTQGLIRTVDVGAVDVSQKNIAFAYATTSERISSGDPIVTKWRLTVHYVIEPALDEKRLQENPLGFVITHFDRVQDSSK